MAQASADGNDFRDICKDGPDCACCSLWRRPDETDAAWRSRLGRIYRDNVTPNGDRYAKGRPRKDRT